MTALCIFWMNAREDEEIVDFSHRLLSLVITFRDCQWRKCVFPTAPFGKE